MFSLNGQLKRIQDTPIDGVELEFSMLPNESAGILTVGDMTMLRDRRSYDKMHPRVGDKYEIEFNPQKDRDWTYDRHDFSITKHERHLVKGYRLTNGDNEAMLGLRQGNEVVAREETKYEESFIELTGVGNGWHSGHFAFKARSENVLDFVVGDSVQVYFKLILTPH